MRTDILLKIRSDPNLIMFLKYNSHLYKDLIRNPDSIKYVESLMKKEYKLTLEDSIEKLGSKVSMIRNFIEILK